MEGHKNLINYILPKNTLCGSCIDGKQANKSEEKTHIKPPLFVVESNDESDRKG